MTSGHPAPCHKPAELFRADLISAMKLPDTMPLESGSFLTIKEPWRTEWEIGVQVCVSPNHILEASARTIRDPPVPSGEFECSQRYIHEDEDSNDYVMYDLDELDLNWLESVNTKRKFRALANPKGLTEDILREALLTLEIKCQQSMARAVATEETLGIEYDEQTTCDVCRDHESEDTNDMIFCDSCNVCVHQACYGVATIPRGEWLCRVCSAGDEQATCILCPVAGGALKRVRPGNTSWAHLCCALWIPEVRVGNADKMEPITNIEAIPPSRRHLVCCICRRRCGSCIQCSHPLCVVAYHVTCGFQQGLDMKSKLDMVTNAVIHESYCPKHTAMRNSPSKHCYHQSPSKRNHMNRPSQLVQLQESFYNYASAEDLVTKLNLPLKLSILLYNYWKLKRKFQHNRPLLSHLPIETSLESIKAELAAGGIKYGINGDEDFLKIIHLRQNLEKARNLVYMVQRRERFKKQMIRIQSEKLKLEMECLASFPQTVAAPTINTSTAQDRSLSDLESTSDDVDIAPRLTRSMAQRASSPSPPPPHLPPHTDTTSDLYDLDHPHSPSPLAQAEVIMNGPSALSSQKTIPPGKHNDSIVECNDDDDHPLSGIEMAPSISRNLRRRELRVGSRVEGRLPNSTDSLSDGGEGGREGDGERGSWQAQRIINHNAISARLAMDGTRGSDTESNGASEITPKTVLNGGLRKRDSLSDSTLSSSGLSCRGESSLSVDVMRSSIVGLAGFKEEGGAHVLRRHKATPNLRIRPYNIGHKNSSRTS